MASIGSPGAYPTPSSGTESMFEKRFQPDSVFRYAEEIQYEPLWRLEADRAQKYYDGYQLDSESAQKAKDLGIQPVIVNMVAPVIDSVSGFEVAVRSDLRVIGETPESYEVAEALNIKLKEALRLTKFNSYVSMQFREMITAGIGWLDVSRNPSPLDYAYRIDSVPWRQMFMDYRSRKMDYSDARFIIRRQWFDADRLKTFFPNHKKEIEMGVTSMQDRDWLRAWTVTGYDDYGDSRLVNGMRLDECGYSSNFSGNIENEEYRHGMRNRIPLFEILYSSAEQITVLRLHTGFSIEYDENNLTQAQLLQSGAATLIQGPITKWRQAFFVGKELLMNNELETNEPHYIPMVCFRSSSDWVPYGMVRRMFSVQDSINSRHTRLLRDTSYRLLVVDEDAVDNQDELLEQMNKTNGVIVMKSERRSERGIDLHTGTDTSQVTYSLLEESKRNMAEVTGIYPEFQGKGAGSHQSGAAIDMLKSQTQQILGPVFSNYETARLKAGERLLSLIRNDLKRLENLEVTDEAVHGRQPRRIVLNARTREGTISNDMLSARTRLALDDVPSNPTYSEQKFQQLTEVTKSFPPELQAAVLDLVVNASSLPGKHELLDRIREITGHGPEPSDPEKAAEMAQAKQAKEELQSRRVELEMAMLQAQVERESAQAKLEMVKAEKLATADLELTDAKTLEILANIGVSEQDQRRKDSALRLDQIGRTHDMARSLDEDDREDRKVELEREKLEQAARQSQEGVSGGA